MGRGARAFYCFVGVLLVLVGIWGAFTWYENAQAKVGGGVLQMKQIAAGASHTCAIASDNKAYCWGVGSSGQLGNGTTTATQTTPVAVSLGAMPAGSTIRQIVVGASHTCAIASDNKAYCWGAAANGRLGNGTTTPNQTTPVAVSLGAMPAGSTIRDITAGGGLTCAIASDNKAYCWGDGGSGQLGNGTTTASQTTPVAVSLGAMPAGSTIKKVVVNSLHTCAIASDNKAYCWGYSSFGQLGDGVVNSSQTTPVAVSLGAMPAGSTITDIAAGDTHTCAIASDKKAYCWGAAANGRLGNGTTSPDKNTAAAVSLGAMPAGATIMGIIAGGTHTCAIASDNKAYCWGGGASGQLGNGTTTASQTTPVAVSDIAHSIDLSQSVYRVYGSSASTSPGSPLAAGNTKATLGSIASDFRLRIGLTNPESSQLLINSVEAGSDRTCAIASDNKAYCWGTGSSGQLGNGTTSTSQTTPSAVSQGAMPAGSTILQIAAGTGHTCAIASDNKAYCWGNGYGGQLGDGTPGQQNTAVAVALGAMPAGSTIRQITAGSTHTCVIASDNKAYCWGYGVSGQVGDGSASQQNTPVAVALGAMPAGSTIRQISAEGDHTCAIASDNNAYCWGLGSYGELGDGSGSQKSTPALVALGAMPAGSTIQQVTSGSYHTCAIASDNNAYCWGFGVYGMLGDGSGAQQNTPVAVALGAMPAGSTIRQISAGGTHTCAIASNNKAYCWGYSTNGQNGDSTTGTIQSTPVAVSLGAVPASATIDQISADTSHTCATVSDGKAYCWGAAGAGRLGNGTTTPDRTSPVAISQGAMVDATATIAASQLSLSLQVAPRGLAATCSVVVSGWTNVSTTSDMNWGSAPPSHGTAISSFGSDPTVPAGTTYAYQSIVRSDPFTNNLALATQKTGLWDFVLHDRSSKSATDYCFRVISATAGTSIDTYSQNPSIATAPGSLATQFVNSSGTPITSPATDSVFSSVFRSSSVQTATAALVDISNKQLEAHNSSSNSGWSMSLAATGGPTATWQSSPNSYPFNASTSSNGQLSVNMTSSSRTAHGTDPTGTTCSTTGTTLGSGTTAFSNVVSAITLATGSPSAQFNCTWRLRDIYLGQTIPANQASGLYTIDMTATIVAI